MRPMERLPARWCQRLRRNTTLLEDVPWDACRINAREGRAARQRRAGRSRSNLYATQHGDHVSRTPQARDRHIVEIDLADLRRTELIISIVRHALQQIALDAADQTIRGMVEVILTTAAFDVAARDSGSRQRKARLAIERTNK